ncbi:FAD-binding oxidoreductase [Planctomyces sp. SH-PL62]|uniref:FAD-binding oxidoreductase n=1 Tax=Planctomyces sp. SH-PL62 TaxID=1636152 RepID=UPI00078BE0D3|nr:FAD-binding oxidoreductase [Planctomyces sp. SH-PL62]AMV39651.1 putative FAD-linked oxidoreductase [Planctomyces sp. SH-PL62]
MKREADALGWPETSGAGPLGDGRFATAVHRPSTVDELCDAVRAEVENSGAVYPQGGASALDYGRPPGRPGAAVDVSSLNRIVDYPHADMTITVQAGMSVAALQGILAEQNQRLLIDVPRPDRATLGGALATGVCGPRRLGLGRPRDSIIGVSFVTSNAVEVKGGGRVVKNVAGYDFPKLLTGSMGTLGIITQATLKVRPLPGASALIWLRADGPERLDEWLVGFGASALRPVAVEFLNPTAARIIAGAAGLAGDSWTLVVGIEDDVNSVAWQVDRFRTEIGRSDFDVLRDEATAPLWKALTEFQVETPGAFACSASLRPSRVAAFLADLPPERWALQAHAGVGVVRMQAIGEWSEDEAAAAVAAKRAQAVGDGGNLIVTRCPTSWKARLRVWGEPRADWALGRAVKAALDPRNVMNPGRFVGEDE